MLWWVDVIFRFGSGTTKMKATLGLAWLAYDWKAVVLMKGDRGYIISRGVGDVGVRVQCTLRRKRVDSVRVCPGIWRAVEVDERCIPAQWRSSRRLEWRKKWMMTMTTMRRTRKRTKRRMKMKRKKRRNCCGNQQEVPRL